MTDQYLTCFVPGTVKVPGYCMGEAVAGGRWGLDVTSSCGGTVEAGSGRTVLLTWPKKTTPCESGQASPHSPCRAPAVQHGGYTAAPLRVQTFAAGLERNRRILCLHYLTLPAIFVVFLGAFLSWYPSSLTLLASPLFPAKFNTCTVHKITDCLILLKDSQWKIQSRVRQVGEKYG